MPKEVSSMDLLERNKELEAEISVIRDKYYKAESRLAEEKELSERLFVILENFSKYCVISDVRK